MPLRAFAVCSDAQVGKQKARAGIERPGSYGAALTRHLRAEGIEVTEVNQPDKPHDAATARPTPSTPRPQSAPC
ncbi:hypothetical protein [Embleya sp. NPDC059237]|uniref:hypothetical protein n=1 Tax=Embleya sp. NPDC059237 TaxID=3346784 RepID=UPI0036798111